jgi:hypothetical protein
MTSRGTWKRRERDVAKALGGRRIPVTGLDRHGADVITPLLHVQAKHGRRRPAFLREWLSGIQADAKPHGKIGIVVWSDTRERSGDAIVMLSLADFTALHGALEGQS